MIDLIHHVGIVVHSADDALGFFRDTMGLTVSEDRVIEEQGVRGVLLAIGENEIELLQPVRDDTGVARYLESKGEILHHICFRTDDIRAELTRLKAAGIDLIDENPRDGLAGEIAFIHPKAMHGVLIELAQPPSDSHTGTEKGFDHLAAMVTDIDLAAADWSKVLGLGVSAKIDASDHGILIGQMLCGQAVMELVQPATNESPLTERISSIGEHPASMIAIEVPDIEKEIARYRSAGMTVSESSPGPIPGTLRASLSADETYGLGIQLISYV